jgi:hypothetical protein
MTATITLDQIQDAVIAGFGDSTPQDQGIALAAIIRDIDASMKAETKPAAKPATIAPAQVRTIADGRTMATAAKSITDGQFKRISAYTEATFTDSIGDLWAMYADEAAQVDVPNAKSLKGISMADAAEFYAWLRS